MSWLRRGVGQGIQGSRPVDKQPPPNPIQVQIEQGDAEGIYANVVFLAHSPSEFILDFARLLPGVPKAKVYARIIMTPQNARALLRALETRIGSYESQFGKIPGQGESSPSRDIGFKTETP